MGATSFGKTSMNATKKSISSKKQLEEEPSPNKLKKIRIIRKIGETSGFQAVDRNQLAINDHVWGIPDGPDLNAYDANHELTKI